MFPKKQTMHKYLSSQSYFNFVLNQVARFIAPVVRRWEIRRIEQYGNKPLQHQPVFIIGAPRTGSTILYQTLTNLYDVLYVDNLVCRFYRNFFFGFWLSNKLYGVKPHNNFKSYQGGTIGGHAPSECGQFWYRWLPQDHHFIDYDEITSRMLEEIRLEISAIINYFDKPLIFKNLNVGQRLRLLTKCFPKARFLFISRAPVQTAQSILMAKRQIGLPDNAFWSIMPPNVNELKVLDWDKQIVNQVYSLEKQIVEDSSLAVEDNFYTIFYKDLSLQFIDELAKKMGFRKREKAMAPDIRVHEMVFIDPSDLERLKAQVDSLDWSGIQR